MANETRETHLYHTKLNMQLEPDDETEEMTAALSWSSGNNHEDAQKVHIICDGISSREKWMPRHNVLLLFIELQPPPNIEMLDIKIKN